MMPVTLTLESKWGSIGGKISTRIKHHIKFVPHFPHPEILLVLPMSEIIIQWAEIILRSSEE